MTPKHNALVAALLQSRCHIIAAMRSKMEYTQVEENGKKQVKKLGMSPIQRDGMEYEFTVFIDLDHHHTATATKDRTTLFDGQYFVPTVETGKALLAWLENNGKAEPEFAQSGKPVSAPATTEVSGRAEGQPGRKAGSAEAGAQSGRQPDDGKLRQGVATSGAEPKASVGETGAKTADRGPSLAGASPQQETRGEAKAPDANRAATGSGAGTASRETATGMSEATTAPESAATGHPGLKSLFARIGSLNLPGDAYKRYCYKRYGVHSMTRLSQEQIAEQAKILDSLKRPSRLKEFRTVLEGFGGNGGSSEAASGSAGAVASGTAPAMNAAADAATLQRGSQVDPAQIPARAGAAGTASQAAGRFDLF